MMQIPDFDCFHRHAYGCVVRGWRKVCLTLPNRGLKP